MEAETGNLWEWGAGQRLAVGGVRRSLAEAIEEGGSEFGAEGEGGFPGLLGFGEAVEGGESGSIVEEEFGVRGRGIEGEGVEIGGAGGIAALEVEGGEGGAEVG